MPIYEYSCKKCKEIFNVLKQMKYSGKDEKCPECDTKGERILSCPNVVGTRDNFGVAKEFYDTKTGKTIDTWKKWEKAGFKDYKDVKDHRNDNITKLTKEKLKSKTRMAKTPWLDYAEKAI